MESKLEVNNAKQNDSYFFKKGPFYKNWNGHSYQREKKQVLLQF